MEDNQTLLMMVLKQHFRDRPQILDEALRIIKDYSDQDSTPDQYEKTVETLRSKMNDLPLHILLYFLNMIPLPKQEANFKSYVIEEIKSNDDQIDSIRPKLIEYLNSKIPPLIPIKKDNSEKKSHLSNFFDNTGAEYSCTAKFVRPKKTWRRRTAKSQLKDKPLLDICAEYIIKNQNYLKQYYRDKKEKAWKMVNTNKYNSNELCLLYEILKDLNKKAKLMRMIDNEEICQEVLIEEYGSSDVFIKEKHLFQSVNDDPFIVSDELQAAIINFVCN
ncbi:hypothetical protein Trydic_g5384 [Trypoxylus dichotomus]